MEVELQNILFEKYPKIFRQKDLPAKETSMCYGITVSGRWFLLLDCLCHLIQHHVDSGSCSQVEATQVKQKFGGLRFYYEGGDKLISDIVRMYETLSYSICERCGSNHNVKLSKSVYVQSLCEACRKIEEKI